MVETLKSIFSVKDLRSKIFYTLVIILIFRVGTFIPIPGFDKIAFEEQFQNTSNTLGSIINVISGGAFSRFSIFAMTIGPYITASIIMNLLAFVIPALEKLQKEGETGKKLIAKYTKYITIIFSVVEAIGLYITYKKFLLPLLQVGAGSILGMILFVISLTAGTSVLMWLGDRITEKGIGNGISMLIFIGIISGIPAGAEALYNYAILGISNLLIILSFILAIIVVIAGVIYIQQAERRIPIQYSKRVVGRKMYGGQNTHIPLKVAMAGVIPIIFAMSFLMFPNMLVQIFTKNNPTGIWLIIQKICVPQGDILFASINSVIYMALIVVFTFFYTMLMVNPIEMANQLKKNAGFIPGIRSGKPTSDYITGVMNNITWFGGFFLALVAIFPIIIQVFMKGQINISFGGTSILIVVGVALEFLKQLESQMVSRHYKGFLD